MLACQIERILADSALADSLGRSGRRYVETHHDWQATTGRLEQIYQRAIEAFWAVRETRPAFHRLSEPCESPV